MCIKQLYVFNTYNDEIRITFLPIYIFQFFNTFISLFKILCNSHYNVVINDNGQGSNSYCNIKI